MYNLQGRQVSTMGLCFINLNLLLVVRLRHHGPFASAQEFLIQTYVPYFINP
jgi:hypothetical protein